MGKGRSRIESGVTVLFIGGNVFGERTQLRAALAQQKPFDPNKDCVEKVTVNGAFHEAHVTPFWGSWSTDFLHSTDIVLATGGVLDQVVDKQDKITCVESVRFYQPLLSGLETFTRVLEPEETATNLLMPGRGKPTYTFTASTQNGNRIGMVGYGSQVAVSRSRHWENPNMGTLFGRLHEAGYNVKSQLSSNFQLTLSPSAKPGVGYNNPAYVTTVAMDVVMGFRQALELIGYVPNFGAALAASFESVDLPPASFFSTTGGVLDLEVDFEKLRVGNSFAILPLAFEFQHFDGTKCGGGIYKVAIAKTEHVVHVTEAWMKRMGRF